MTWPHYPWEFPGTWRGIASHMRHLRGQAGKTAGTVKSDM